MAKKNTFLTEHLPLADFPISVYFLLELKKVDVRFKKKKMKFCKEKLKITSNIAQNQEQVAVSSIASVVKPSTFSHILHEFHEIKLNVMKYALNCVSWNSLTSPLEISQNSLENTFAKPSGLQLY